MMCVCVCMRALQGIFGEPVNFASTPSPKLRMLALGNLALSNLHGEGQNMLLWIFYHQRDSLPHSIWWSVYRHISQNYRKVQKQKGAFVCAHAQNSPKSQMMPNTGSEEFLSTNWNKTQTNTRYLSIRKFYCQQKKSWIILQPSSNN